MTTHEYICSDCGKTDRPKTDAHRLSDSPLCADCARKAMDAAYDRIEDRNARENRS